MTHRTPRLTGATEQASVDGAGGAGLDRGARGTQEPNADRRRAGRGNEESEARDPKREAAQVVLALSRALHREPTAIDLWTVVRAMDAAPVLAEEAHHAAALRLELRALAKQAEDRTPTGRGGERPLPALQMFGGRRGGVS